MMVTQASATLTSPGPALCMRQDIAAAEKQPCSIMATIDSLVDLLKAVRSQDPSLQRVVVENKRLPSQYITSLLDAVSENKHVTILKLSRVGVNDSVAKAVADCVRNSPSLIDVDLSRNSLSDIGCLQIVNALRENAANGSIIRLNLESNKIGDQGVQDLCEAIALTSVSVLKIGKNEFGLEGLHSIAKLIERQESPVKSLNLRNLKFGNAGASILAGALSNGTTLQHVCLSRNDIDNQGITQLAQALTWNKEIRSLDIRHNDFDDNGAAAFVKALKTNDTLTTLKIRDTAVSGNIKAQLFDSLLINSFGQDLARKTKDALSCWDGGRAADREVSECVICFEKMSNCTLLPCRHSNCCIECGEQLHNCHMCRTAIVKIMVTEFNQDSAVSVN